MVTDLQGQLILTCPTCRQATPVPANGVASLQSAFQVNHLLEILEDHKKAKDTAASQEGAKSIVTHPICLKVITNYCLDHADKERELYCETCGDLICFKCAIKGGKHIDHNYSPLDEAFERYKGEITPSLEPLEKKLEAVKKALTQLDKCSTDLSVQQAAIEANISDTIGQLHEVLEVRRTELIGQLHETIQRKLKNLAVQKDELEIIQAQLSSCFEFTRESLKTSNQEEVLMMKTNIVNQVNELTTPFPPDTLEPNTEADMKFLVSPDMTDKCRTYGQIFSPGSPNPSKCQATADDQQGSLIKKTEYTFDCSVKKVEIICPSKPRGIAVNKNGEIVVAEFEEHCVSIYNRDGVKQRTFGSRGSTFGRFLHPRGIVMDADENILVVERDNHRIQKFTPHGNFMAAVGSKGTNRLEFSTPKDIAFNPFNKKIYIVDQNRVQVLNSDLTFYNMFGKKGSNKEQFDRALGIACDSTGKVYVADTYNHRIQVFTAEGQFLKLFGKQGRNDGEFNLPAGIAIDPNDIVYISERGNNRVSVFKSNGEFMTSLGGMFKEPRGLFVHGNELYVCDTENNCIQILPVIFDMKNLVLSS